MKHQFEIALGIAVSGLALIFARAGEASVLGAEEPVNYARPFEPPTRPAFIPLPPGTVEPEGWLRDWCLAARDGYTGRMDQVHVEFQRAWALDHRMTGERLQWPKGGWPYEGGGYWLDGLARLGYVLHDDALVEQAKKRLDVVGTHMNPDSILLGLRQDHRGQSGGPGQGSERRAARARDVRRQPPVV